MSRFTKIDTPPADHQPAGAPRCPLTGAPMRPLMRVDHDWRRPADRKAWPIWWSDNAGFGQIHPRPSAEDVAQFYDLDSYYTHDGDGARDPAAEARAVGWMGRLLGKIAWRFDYGIDATKAPWWQALIPPGAQNSLEIGCGDGDRMLTYRPFVGHVRGVEPDPFARNRALSRGLDVHAGLAEDLPASVTSDRYDLIVFCHVLEHTRDPLQALKNAVALLKPGGILTCEVPNNACLGASIMGTSWRWLDVPRHLNFFTERSLRGMAEMAGLQVDEVLFTGYVRQFKPDWLLDEVNIRAELAGRKPTQADIAHENALAARVLALSLLAPRAKKYDSVRIIARRV